MDETTDSAYAFGYEDIVLIIPLFNQFFQTTVNIPDGRNCFDDLLIFEDQVEMDGFG
jgi:hypothetical protein